VQINAFRPCGNGAHQSQVSAVSPHHFDNKTPVKGHRRLLNLVHNLDNTVQSCVGADTQLRAWQIVVYARWNADYGYVKSREIVALFIQPVRGVISCPAAYHHKRIHPMPLENLRTSVQLRTLRGLPAAPQLRSPRWRPAVDGHPIHLFDIVVNQAPKAPLDAQWNVAVVLQHANDGTRSRVHPRRRRPSSQDGNPQSPLVRLRRARVRPNQRPQYAERVLVGLAPVRHCLVKPALVDTLADPMSLFHALRQ